MKSTVAARRWLLLYLLAVVAITLIHEPLMLGAALCLALLLAGAQRRTLLRRTIFAVIAFNSTVSLGYIIVALWQGSFTPDYLLLVNLRTLLLVFLGFWLVSAVNVLAALAGWPLLSLLATLAIGQSKTFERVLRDFRLAFESRNLAPPRLVDKFRSAAAQTQTLLDKSIASANDAALSMRSRGAFDD